MKPSQDNLRLTTKNNLILLTSYIFNFLSIINGGLIALNNNAYFDLSVIFTQRFVSKY